MRKVDVFGKKQNLTRPFYLIILIFAVVLPGYFIIQNFFAVKNAELMKERLSLQASISDLFEQSQAETLLTIDEMIPFLPATFSQNAVNNELSSIKDLAGMTLASNYQVAFEEADLPFDEPLPDTVKAMKLTVTMTVDDAVKLLDYIDSLKDLGTIYYLESFNVTYLSNPNANVQLILYTFYNDVVIE